MGWTFVYLMLFLKLPIAGLGWIVWWAIKQAPEDVPGDSGEGGVRPPHPRAPRPRPRPRGPHGDPQPPAPERTRPAPVSVRAKHHD